MDKVLIVTKEKRASLDGYQVDCHRIEFVQDADGNYVCNKENLDNPAFKDIKGELTGLVEIDAKFAKEASSEKEVIK